MGNCLVHQPRVVRIMKMDGEVLEYQVPIKVQEVLTKFIGHAISDALPVLRHLPHCKEMVCGHMYYLLPPPLPSTYKVDDESVSTKGTGFVRVKLVLTKQELKQMLSKGGISVDDMLSKLQTKQSKDEGADEGSCRSWKPVLYSIPE